MDRDYIRQLIIEELRKFSDEELICIWAHLEYYTDTGNPYAIPMTETNNRGVQKILDINLNYLSEFFEKIDSFSGYDEYIIVNYDGYRSIITSNDAFNFIDEDRIPDMQSEVNSMYSSLADEILDRAEDGDYSEDEIREDIDNALYGLTSWDRF